MATAILQVRSGSKRLPEKALLEVGGKPMFFYSLSCLQKSRGVDRIVVATTDSSRDREIVKLAKNFGVDCFTGDEEDVLGRFVAVAEKFPDTVYFRATADNPLIDIDNPWRSLNALLAFKAEYCMEKGMPVGSVVEVFTADALHKAAQLTADPVYREHVTLIMKESSQFVRLFVDCPPDYYYPHLSLTVDHRHEFYRMKKLIEELGEAIFDFRKVIDYVLKRIAEYSLCQEGI